MNSKNSPDMATLINCYLDETLSDEDHVVLFAWIKTSEENAGQFAQALLLHDRLRGEHLAQVAVEHVDLLSEEDQREHTKSVLDSPRRRWQPRLTAVTFAGAALLIIAVLWKGIGETPAAAAVAEIHRIITANTQTPDRTYRIGVEEQAAISRRELPENAPERSRPPKTPNDGAVLHVRGGGQFVLIRQTPDGEPVVSGCNGQTSWTIRAHGPVKSSPDLAHFNRDVPGHEHSMPLININEGLERLLVAYETQLLPVEDDAETSTQDEPSRLLVAVRKRGFRGPKRVEITYSINSGLIRQMRFIEMPYGPDKLTLRMTLAEVRPLGERFFDPESHRDTKSSTIGE